MLDSSHSSTIFVGKIEIDKTQIGLRLKITPNADRIEMRGRKREMRQNSNSRHKTATKFRKTVTCSYYLYPQPRAIIFRVQFVSATLRKRTILPILDNDSFMKHHGTDFSIGSKYIAWSLSY
jgi:hypothetical protein